MRLIQSVQLTAKASAESKPITTATEAFQPRFRRGLLDMGRALCETGTAGGQSMLALTERRRRSQAFSGTTRREASKLPAAS